MENISIRNAQSRDIEQIMRIEHGSFEGHVFESRSVFLDRIDTFQEGVLVLEIRGDVCGYISSEIWDYSEEIANNRFNLDHMISDVHTTAGSELYISSIGILKEYRGKGYGKLLFSELSCRMIERYRISSMILIVSTKWDVARRIYENGGFKEVHRIPDFFGEGEEGIIMRRHL